MPCYVMSYHVTCYRMSLVYVAQLILISSTGQRMKCGKEEMNDVNTKSYMHELGLLYDG